MSKFSRSSKSSKNNASSGEFTAALSQFMAVTGLPIKDATKYIQRYGQADLAIDAYYNDPHALPGPSGQLKATPSLLPSKLNALFDKYQAPGGTGGDDDIISIDGTIRLCSDLCVDPEDVVLLAVAYELKAPGVGEFTRAGWREGWRALGIDALLGMKNLLPQLRRDLGSEFSYFRKVYLYTFEFARSEGQRSLSIDTAQAFWGLLLPHAVHGGALAHVSSEDDDEEPTPDGAPGWNDKLTEQWLKFLGEKSGKGISRDTWNQFISFVRTVDPTFQKHDFEGAWPSAIDDFVEWVKGHPA